MEWAVRVSARGEGFQKTFHDQGFRKREATEKQCEGRRET
jgi:hypothetical protein